MKYVRQFEIGVSVLIILICAVVIYESLDLPPGSFEPLGSAPVPQATAGLIILLCLIVIWGAIRRKPAEPEDVEGAVPDEPVSALLLAAATVLYVLILHLRLVGFAPLTASYLFIVISALERFKPKALIGAAIIGVLFGFGIQYLFTQVFVVDLPAT